MSEEKQKPIWNCPHCGMPIVDGKYMLVPRDAWDRLADTATTHSIVSHNRKKLKLMVGKLVTEAEKVVIGLSVVKDGIERAAEVLNPTWEKPWPYKEEKKHEPKRYALPLDVVCVKDRNDKVIQAVVNDANGEIVGPLWDSEEAAKAHAAIVTQNGGVL